MTIQVRSNEKPVTQSPEAKAEGATAQEHHETTSAPEVATSEHHSESDTEITEAKEEVESEESESHEDGESEAKDDDKSGKPKKKGGFQRRIDKLNSRISAKEQELEYWKQQALTAGTTKAQEPKTEQSKAAKANDPSKPNPEKFDTHAEYVEALTDWKTDQKLKERDQKLEQSKIESEQKNIVQSYIKRKEEFAEKVADFDDVIESVDDIQVSPAVRDSILTSEYGPALAYELAKNREEYARVCKLPPLAAAREMGKIEARLASKAPTETNLKKITSAPKPLEPVKAGGKGTAPKSIFDSGLSQSEYERLRMEQLKKRRQA